MNESSHPPVQSLSPGLLRAVLHISHYLRDARKPDRPGPTAMLVLGILHRRKTGTASGIAKELGVKKQSLTAVLKQLQATGCIRKEHDGEDGRKVALSLTAQGEQTFRGDMQTRKARLEQLMESALAPQDRAALATLLPVLEKLADAALATDREAG
ncbi:hypothetical protein KL86DPRO_30097 [uncultured delta proteobacterium]|uniref:HTH marR-type domain-containing protein n=1 Tax=uncultured delta proteobacterium TaxID=34034 RepID=A0A212K7J3_9DELT|nr:hypothetical protein KL86DPRO_30097 [uncultured delta proteobacterium]